ncbi:hypothetical protein Y1Q_0011102 [Alligator mississippiensis]|uniref:NAD(P)(+)--arginine ADP-ribosyltransferase n=1 Tax=Alligator mississippiensis TaxID=8496 RepID=A0A151PJB8_ALLMI|nr:hypothetical protein Y1Q_0011102 [Alligator mississippiensis]
MWSQGILFFLCVLGSTQTQQGVQTIEMSMMPGVVDDQYIGCTEEMERIAPKLLEMEKNNSGALKSAWEKTGPKWEEVNKGEKNEKCIERSGGRRGITFPHHMSPLLFGASILLANAAALTLFGAH